MLCKSGSYLKGAEKVKKDALAHQTNLSALSHHLAARYADANMPASGGKSEQTGCLPDRGGRSGATE